jgi:hypothetical protein
VEDLTLKVGKVYHVVIYNTQRTHSSRRQIEKKRRAETAGAHHQDPGVEDPRLPCAAYLAQDDVAGITLELVLVEILR